MNHHPLAELLPMLDDGALRELAADIREHGLREPIATLDGMVLDGRNRLRACELAGVKPSFVAFTGDALAFVASKNLYRRHLNESQRALVGARVIEIYERAPDASADEQAAIGASVTPPIGGTPGVTTPPIGGRSASATRAASLVNVGVRSVERARQVVKSAVPEVVAAVERGQLAVSAAAELARLAPDEQRRQLAAPPAPRHRPTPPPTPHPAQAVESVHAEAARLEARLESVTNDICDAGHRVQALLVGEIERSLRRLARIAKGAAA